MKRVTYGTYANIYIKLWNIYNSISHLKMGWEHMQEIYPMHAGSYSEGGARAF